ncbi:MAG: hypothetical protein LAT75_01485 [Candidatus Cyclonatronum sp.]|uniref:hypothetical protein n=1 Tax=Cyclonatronum sp. TaxID=3024185 RepID=UPI0025BCE264|nr:hypothetical protein [Cyclonatronum sp.]MCC5934604.1 hypothetical protein [Balneolales bacterium]MCH8485503.1 hypothetical protein [Cyclonatronum sp.]
MRHILRAKSCKLVWAAFFAVIIFSVLPVNEAQARQTIEPEIRPASGWVSPLDFGLRHGATFNLNITNHGFSISGQYRYVLGPHTQWVSEAGFGNIKDSREQAFVTWFGQQIIPNKYNRVLNFPVMTGVRQRLLADYIEDNFRFYVSGMLGASFSFVYPYFEDLLLEDGPAQVQLPGSRIYDVFQGWGDGSWQTGWSGKLALAVDFGQTFNTLTSLEFGVMGHYYPKGIQIMEPNRLVEREGFLEIERGTGFPAQKLFLTPTITLMFGGMW